MITKFRAWHKTWEEMGKVKRIRFDDDGNVTNVLFKGETLGTDLKIDEIELMQSTGLKDKNGQEIFAGDIIDTTDYEGGLSSVGNPLVKVESDKYGFIVTGDFPCSPITLKEFEDGRKFAGVKVKIIGNVYENPEFLEADHDRN